MLLHKIILAKNDKYMCVCVCVCVFTDGNLKLSISISDSAALTATERYNKCTGNFHCRVHGCLSTFRRACQLAAHYTEFHPCDFSLPRDQHDLEMYNRGINSCLVAVSGKRKRAPLTSEHVKTKKRTRTKSG